MHRSKDAWKRQERRKIRRIEDWMISNDETADAWMYRGMEKTICVFVVCHSELDLESIKYMSAGHRNY